MRYRTLGLGQRHVQGLKIVTQPADPAVASDDLAAQAIKYVKYLEELIECPVVLLSTSPERDDTILMKDPFED